MHRVVAQKRVPFGACSMEKIGDRVSGTQLSWLERLQDIRSRLCAQMEVSEELIPLNTLRAFYRKHHSTASMPVQYPDSTVVKETLPLRVVQAYCRELRGRTLPALGSRCAAMFGGIIGAQVIGQ